MRLHVERLPPAPMHHADLAPAGMPRAATNPIRRIRRNPMARIASALHPPSTVVLPAGKGMRIQLSSMATTAAHYSMSFR